MLWSDNYDLRCFAEWFCETISLRTITIIYTIRWRRYINRYLSKAPTIAELCGEVLYQTPKITVHPVRCLDMACNAQDYWNWSQVTVKHSPDWATFNHRNSRDDSPDHHNILLSSYYFDLKSLCPWAYNRSVSASIHILSRTRHNEHNTR